MPIEQGKLRQGIEENIRENRVIMTGLSKTERRMK